MHESYLQSMKTRASWWQVHEVPSASVQVMRQTASPLDSVRGAVERREFPYPLFQTFSAVPLRPLSKQFYAPTSRMATPEEMLKILQAKGRALNTFHKGDVIEVDNKMRKGYSYKLDAEPGQDFAPDFKPYSSPGDILAMGAFEGKYLNDCLTEFPAEWFLRALALNKLSPQKHNVEVNYFKIMSRLPLSEWEKKGWLPPQKGQRRHKNSLGRDILNDPEKNPDERGWFQWYCRYWMGRRMPELDKVQIARWKAFTRHAGAVKKNCKAGDLSCRPKQRQALLHWAYDPFI